jgi:AcrR family transcriptional regulator
VKITEAAGVAQGTFYLYFSSKQEIFEELVRDLNRRVRHAMAGAPSAGETRVEAELLGFAGVLRVRRAARRALPDHPPGRVRLAGDAARPLRGDRSGYVGRSRVGDGRGEVARWIPRYSRGR